MNIVAQIVGFLALVTWLLSIQLKDKKKVLICQIVANGLYGIQYYLLGALTAACMNLVSFLRSSVFYVDSRKDNKTSIYSLIFFLLAILILGILTFTNLFNLIPIVVTFTYSYAIWQKNMQFNRLIFVLAGLTWIYYNLQVGAYVLVGGNILEIISGTIALIRFRKK